MPLTTYVAGDVLTASSLNDNFTFAAANPPASAAGLTFITGSAFTTVTSFSLPDDTFTSTFQNYKMFVNITALTADADFTVRLRAAGSDITTANYATAFVGLSINNNSSNQASANVTAINFAEGNGATTENYNAVFDILNPKATSRTSIFANIQFRDKAGALFEVTRTGLGLSFFTNSCDSLSFISSIASSITGSFRVYGYANS